MQKEQAYDRPHRHHYDAEMLDVEEALERILTFFKPLSAEDVPLLEALGQVLAEPLVAPINIPPLDNSAMDGYAVRAADVAGAQRGSRKVWFQGGWRDTPIMARDALPIGARFDGPAVLEQLDTTIIIEPGNEVAVDGAANLVINVPPAFRS